MRIAALATGLVMLAAAPTPAQGLYDLDTIRTIHLTFQQSNWWQQLENNYNARNYIRANLIMDGTLYPDVGVRFRGNSSFWGLTSGQQKNPFEISMDHYVPDQELLGYETINLNNNFLDPTFVREVMAYEIEREYMPAPKSCYVWLKLNEVDWGLYINTQQVNKDMIKEWFPSKDGNRYRGERDNLGSNANATAFVNLGSTPTLYQRGFQLKSTGSPNPWVDLRDTARVLNATSPEVLPSVLPDELDVDNVLWFLAATNTLLFIDNYVGRYCHNFYLYHDLYHGRISLMPWDQNSAWGGYADPGQSVTSLHTISPYYAYSRSGGKRPLMTRTMAVPMWRQRYDHHMRTIVKEHCNWAHMSNRISELQAFIDDAVQNDPNPLYSYQQFTSNVNQTVTVRASWGSSTVPGLEQMIAGRESVLLAHPTVGLEGPTISGLKHTPAKPQPGAQTFVVATIGGTVGVANPVVYYRTRGAFSTTPMFDDGLHGDGQAGDGEYGGTVPGFPAGSIVDYYVGANSSAPAGAVSFEPSTAGHQPPSYLVSAGTLIVLNELLADNSSGDVDEFGEYEDWVEIYNRDTTAYDLSGHYLSDDLSEPAKWQFPAGTTVPAGGHVRVWCDDNTAQGPLHTNFKLSKDGEQVGLFDTEANGNALLDIIVFGQQKEDRSFGRVSDGGGLWFYIYTPSGNAPLFGPGREAIRYDARRKGSPLNFDLKFSGSVQAGAIASFDFTGGPPSSAAFMLISGGPGYFPLPPYGPLGISPVGLAALPLALDANGSASVPLGVPAGIQGLTVHAQGLAADFSNALTVRF